MKTFRDILNEWPTLADFAADVGVSENTAKQMRTRNSVNAKYWLAMIAAAPGRGIDLTFEQLAGCAVREDA